MSAAKSASRALDARFVQNYLFSFVLLFGGLFGFWMLLRSLLGAFGGRKLLKNIKQLKFWPVDEVLQEKYHFATEDAEDVADFITPCLDFDPNDRATGLECLRSDWLRDDN